MTSISSGSWEEGSQNAVILPFSWNVKRGLMCRGHQVDAYGVGDTSDEQMRVSMWPRVDALHPANSTSPGTAEKGNNKRKLRIPDVPVQNAFSTAEAKISGVE